MAKKKYTVYLTATDEWLCEGTSGECSAELGITQGTFAWHASQCRQGSPSKYLIKEHKSNETMSKDEFVKRLSDQQKAKLKKDEIVIPEEKLVKREEIMEEKKEDVQIPEADVNEAVCESVEKELTNVGSVYRHVSGEIEAEILFKKGEMILIEERSLELMPEETFLSNYRKI